MGHGLGWAMTYNFFFFFISCEREGEYFYDEPWLNCDILFMWMLKFSVPAEIWLQHLRRSSICEGYSNLCNKSGPWQDYIRCKWVTSSYKWCQKAYATCENSRGWTLSNIAFKGSEFWIKWWLDSGMNILLLIVWVFTCRTTFFPYACNM